MAESKTLRTDAQRNAEIAEMTARVIAASSSRYTVFFHDGKKHHNVARLPPPIVPFKFTDDDWFYIRRGTTSFIKRFDEGQRENVVLDIHAHQWIQVYSMSNATFNAPGFIAFDLEDKAFDVKTTDFEELTRIFKKSVENLKWCC